MESEKETGDAVKGDGSVMMIWKSRKEKFSFTDAELAVAAGKVCEAMLNSLPEPEECKREFSAEFEQKMKKLFAKEKTFRIMVEIRRYVAAVLILLIIGMGTIFAFNTEARAAFADWVRRIYENSIIYEFFGEQTNDVLPTYELGWVPEGYEAVNVYRSDRTYRALFQKGNDKNDVFVIEYEYERDGGIIKILGDMKQHTVTQEIVTGNRVDFCIAKIEAESNMAIWIDEGTGVVFRLSCYFEKSVMLNIIEHINLVK